MNTIYCYLENIFQAFPKTDEVVKLKNELLNNMEDKYNELKSNGKSENEAIGIVISEFGNIEELIAEMNIQPQETSAALRPTLSWEDAQKYVFSKVQSSKIVSIGVTLILLGVSLFMGLYSFPLFNSNSDFIELIPIIFLLIFVAIAVLLFIYSDTLLTNYKFIENGDFILSPEALAIVHKNLPSASKKHSSTLMIAIALLILSPICLFIGAAFDDIGACIGFSILILIVAAAVFIIIYFDAPLEAYKKLLHDTEDNTAEYYPDSKQNNKVIAAVSSIVWHIAVCIFLYAGFVNNEWATCWIVFPITGILFGAFCTFYNTLHSK